MPSGLTVYKAHFRNADGTDGVIGGPHKIFTNIEKFHHLSKGFVSNQFSLYQQGYQVCLDVPLLGYRDDLFDIEESENFKEVEEKKETDLRSFTVRQIKRFNEAEHAGSEITYRCVKCRSCKECKNHDETEAVSIREEVEQDLIDRSVKVDVQNCITTAVLPIIHDPGIKLSPNKHKALKVYNQQLQKLQRNPIDKEAVIKSEGKLQQLGHVDYVKKPTSRLADSVSFKPSSKLHSLARCVEGKLDNNTMPNCI